MIRLADYCKCGIPECFKIDSMNAVVQRLGHVYSEVDHCNVWNILEHCWTSEDLLINNPDLDLLLKAHRVRTARYEGVSLKA